MIYLLDKQSFDRLLEQYRNKKINTEEYIS